VVSVCLVSVMGHSVVGIRAGREVLAPARPACIVVGTRTLSLTGTYHYPLGDLATAAASSSSSQSSPGE
jgi:hypothetical protein